MKTIAILGLGYVGLGLAVALSKTYPVYGFDISKKKIQELQNNSDSNHEVTNEELAECTVQFVDILSEATGANFYIITVPTPAYFYELPNLDPLTTVVESLAPFLKINDIIVFESTVYPGVVEDICIPLFEKFSTLKNGIDFHVGYSPERINPQDKQHTLKTITKIIAAQDKKTLKAVQEVYESICDTVYPVSNIKTAEAVKILENTQRDINVAIMNEFAKIMHALDLNVNEIIEAAKTKWSFIDFRPGFVGGHCIAIDPLYLAFKAKRLGINPDLIQTARKINDSMPLYVIQELKKILAENELNMKKCKIGIFGITYKANTPDIRASLALKFIKELENCACEYQIHDPLADKKVVEDKYNIQLQDFDAIEDLSVAVIVVSHEFYREVGLKKFVNKFKKECIIMDIPNLFVAEAKQYEKMIYWNL